MATKEKAFQYYLYEEKEEEKELAEKIKKYVKLNPEYTTAKGFISDLINKELKNKTLDNTVIELDRPYSYDGNILFEKYTAIATPNNYTGDLRSRIELNRIPNNLDKFNLELKTFCYIEPNIEVTEENINKFKNNHLGVGLGIFPLNFYEDTSENELDSKELTKEDLEIVYFKYEYSPEKLVISLIEPMFLSDAIPNILEYPEVLQELKEDKENIERDFKELDIELLVIKYFLNNSNSASKVAYLEKSFKDLETILKEGIVKYNNITDIGANSYIKFLEWKKKEEKQLEKGVRLDKLEEDYINKRTKLYNKINKLLTKLSEIEIQVLRAKTTEEKAELENKLAFNKNNLIKEAELLKTEYVTLRELYSKVDKELDNYNKEVDILYNELEVIKKEMDNFKEIYVKENEELEKGLDSETKELGLNIISLIEEDSNKSFKDIVEKNDTEAKIVLEFLNNYTDIDSIFNFMLDLEKNTDIESIDNVKKLKETIKDINKKLEDTSEDTSENDILKFLES